MARTLINRISAPAFAVIVIFVLGMLMACIFFGVYTIDRSPVMLQMGIAFAAISITIAGFYTVRKHVARARLKHGRFCKSQGSCGRCGDSCIRLSLCLSRQESVDGVHSDARSLVNHDVIGIWAQLEGLHQELNRLMREYAQIEPVAVDRELMRHSRCLLLEDQAVLFQWMEGPRMPTWRDIEIMSNRLDTVNAMFEVERERHQNARHMTLPVSSIAYSDRAYHSTELRSEGSYVGPPNMAENEADIRTGSLPPQYLQHPDHQSISSLGRPRPTHFTESVNYRLPVYLTGQEEHPVPLPPYADNPPSYEETMNMTY